MRTVSFLLLITFDIDHAECPTVASKFFEHFILISDAMTFRAGEAETSLWNDKDG